MLSQVNNIQNKKLSRQQIDHNVFILAIKINYLLLNYF